MKIRQAFAAIIFAFMASYLIVAQSEQFSINQSPLPAPTGMVNDYANIIDDATQAQIEQKLRDFKAKTNPQVEIAVVTVKTTGDRPIFDYSLAVARGWKIGSKDDDNPSALLLIAVDDRKYFTQISKDLEDELPDGILGQLQRQYLVPAFKQGNYTKGINDTVDSYIRTIEERKSAPTSTPKPSSGGSGGISGIFCCIVIIIVVVILIIVLSSIGKGGGSGGGGGSRSDRDRWRSGGFGGNTSNSGYSSPVIIWGSGGSGGSSSWGGSSGGGDSWGGFGGGGDFGGGGAGGDW